MKSSANAGTIKVSRLPGEECIELHSGTSVVRTCPRHWHEEYNLCLIEAGGGTLYYRGAAHHTPTGCLFIVHPGEVHANDAYAGVGCTYRNFYFPPDLLGRIARELSGRNALPYFPQIVADDRAILRQYQSIHQTLEGACSRLEQESLVLSFLARLIRRHAAGGHSPAPVRREHAAVKRAKSYLAANLAENVSLESLASVARLSPFHLNRVFALEAGLPPHAFQTQLRILEAQKLLRDGRTISAAAFATGFADQSHLTRHFKRVLGIPPGEYRGDGSARGRNGSRNRAA